MTALVSKPTNPLYYIQSDRDRDEWSKSVWLGPLVERFGLTDFQPRHFLNFWYGREPHGGKPLVDNHKSPKRVHAFEFVLSFDGRMKLLELAPDPQWKTVQLCKMEAYKEVAALIQDRCGWTRRGHGGEKKERAQVVMALHPDLESRWGGAPLGHAHLTLMNLAFLGSGEVLALDGSRPYRDQKLYNAALNLAFANQVTNRLGLRVERRGDYAVLPGNFDHLLRDLSPASETIKREMKENGFHSPKAARIIAQKQKPAKEKRTVQDLRASWQKTASRHGFSWQRLERRRPVKELSQSLASAEYRTVKHAENAMTKLTREKSLVTERELLTEALLSAIGKNLSMKQVMEGVEHVVRSRQIHALGQVKGSQAFTTTKVWKSERRTLLHAEALAKKDRLLVTPDPARGGREYLAWGRHLKVIRPENIESLLDSFDKGSRLNAHWEAFRAARGPGFGLDIQARLRAAEQAYREARKPSSKPDPKTVYLVEDIHKIPTETLERLLKHVRDADAKVVLREPPDGPKKAVSGILPQLLDLNREGKLEKTQERRQVHNHEMRLIQ
jgi:conjugative relaxase-like TrwC/TraI family protein